MSETKKRLKEYVKKAIQTKDYLEDVTVKELVDALGWSEAQAQELKNSQEYKEFKEFWNNFWKN